MVEAQVYINVAGPEGSLGDPPVRYSIEGALLRRAAEALQRLQLLGWRVTFDPFGFLDEGFVEWIATKRFAGMEHARAEIRSAGPFREIRPRTLPERYVEPGASLRNADDNDDRETLLAFALDEGPPGLLLSKLSGRTPGAVRVVDDSVFGMELEIPFGALDRRMLRVGVRQTHPLQPDGSYVRICAIDGTERGRWDYRAWKSAPRLIMAEIVAAAAGLDAEEDAHGAR